MKKIVLGLVCVVGILIYTNAFSSERSTNIYSCYSEIVFQVHTSTLYEVLTKMDQVYPYDVHDIYKDNNNFLHAVVSVTSLNLERAKGLVSYDALHSVFKAYNTQNPFSAVNFLGCEVKTLN